MKELEATYLSLYDEEADALYRFAFFRTNDHEQALDIVQESFLALWKAMRSGQRIDALRSFLYRIARNLLIDRYRKEGRARTDSLDRYLEEGGDVADDDPHGEYDTLDLERVRALLAELEPPEYREALVLRYGLDWSPKEIARVLEVSENVVSVRIHRAIDKLRNSFIV
jgi:RNA polymerase sigma-70 factor (ECF subfamily)